LFLLHMRGATMAGWIVLVVGVANLILWCIDRIFGKRGDNK